MRHAESPAVLLATLALAALSGCSSSDICARNSDCQVGNYCSGGTCISDCTAATVADDCASGESCNTFGMCVAPPDGGMRDAGPPRPDGGPDSPDLRAPCVIAGGTDADGDGYCAAGSDADCDEGRPSVNPGAPEICTPQDATVVDRAVDENCDGAVDEGCGWFFGEPHWSTDLQLAGPTRPSWVSPDGLRLYLTATIAGRFQPYVAERPSLDARFERPTPLGAPFGTYQVYSVDLSDDELEMIVGASADGSTTGSDLYLTTRTERSARFGPLVRIAEVSTDGGSESEPRMSRDGLEVVFTSYVAGGQRLLHATRTARSLPFAAPEALVFTGLASDADGTAWIVRDGRTLLIRVTVAGQTTFYAATRSSARTAIFDSVAELDSLVVSGADHVYPVWSEATSEMFFGSSRAWSPASASTWRVRVCRDGSCPPRTTIDCPSSRRSEDGLHCYSLYAATGPWANAYSSCGTGHLATIHSAAENALLVATVGGTRAWLGGYDGDSGVASVPTVPECSAPGCSFAWATEEPWTYSNWGAGEPNNGLGAFLENALEMNADRWNDAQTSSPLAALCETEIWPTW